jgi:hypothetical protein
MNSSSFICFISSCIWRIKAEVVGKSEESVSDLRIPVSIGVGEEVVFEDVNEIEAGGAVEAVVVG